MKFSCLFVVVLVVTLALSAPLFAAELVILHTNDVHGRLTSPDGADGSGGLVKLATIVDEMRDRYNNNVLLLDAGDTIHGTNVVNLFAGLAAVEVMNSMGYAAQTLGNHDFNYGQEALLERMQDAKYPFLAANVTYATGEQFAKSALIQEVNGIRVGIVGVSSQETPISTHPNNVDGLIFHDPIAVAGQLGKRIRPDVDLLIALTHIGYSEDVRLAEEFPEFDVIVGGHSHTTLQEPVDVGGVLLVQNHEYANNLGFLRVIVEDRQIVDYQGMLIPVDAETPAQPEVLNIVEQWEVLLGERLNQVIGEIPVFFDGERESVRVKETNLGNLVADVMRAATEADIAFNNGGGIRASMNAGEVTVGDVYTVLPFDNTLSVIQLRGADIMEALEFSVRLLPEQNGGFLQVSGLKYDVNPNMSEGRRVSNVWVNDELMEMDKLYTVATNDFLAVGGDGYEVLQNGTLVAETGMMLRDVMADYFMEHGVVPEPESGRIIILD